MDWIHGLFLQTLKAVRQSLSFVGAALTTDLGRWLLTTVLAGLIINFVSQHNECQLARDHDIFVDLQEEVDFRLMVARLLPAIASAKSKEDLVRAASALSQSQSFKLLHANNGKSFYDLYIDHVVATNRWSESRASYFANDEADELAHFALGIVNKSAYKWSVSDQPIEESELSEITRRARDHLKREQDLEDYTFWNQTGWTTNCDFLDVLLERFRRVPSDIQ